MAALATDVCVFGDSGQRASLGLPDWDDDEPVEIEYECNRAEITEFHVKVRGEEIDPNDLGRGVSRVLRAISYDAYRSDL